MRKILLFITFFIFFEGYAYSEEDCEKNAESQMALSRKYDSSKQRWSPEHIKILQRAQDYYLCAVQQGNLKAGYMAASLSDSGDAKELEPAVVEKLYFDAANAGHKEASLTMATRACGPRVDVCEHPAQANEWLRKAVQQGNAKGAILLGVSYETGSGTPININKAWACYSHAAKQGDKSAKDYLRRLANTVSKNSQEVCN